MYGGTVDQDDLAFAKLAEKIPGLKREDLDIHGLLSVRKLPCEAPWLSPFGACLVMITDIRRGKEGRIEFQLGDDKATPYEGGNVWVTSNKFYKEWAE